MLYERSGYYLNAIFWRVVIDKVLNWFFFLQISPRWYNATVSHFSQRRQLPIIHSMSITCSCGIHPSIAMIVPYKFRFYFGLRNWDVNYIPDNENSNVRCVRIFEGDHCNRIYIFSDLQLELKLFLARDFYQRNSWIDLREYSNVALEYWSWNSSIDSHTTSPCLRIWSKI